MKFFKINILHLFLTFMAIFAISCKKDAASTNSVKVSTLAGSGNPAFANGQGTSASFYGVSGLTTDAAGNVYCADLFNQLIRKITPGGLVTSYAGNGPNANYFTSTFKTPVGVVADANGQLFVADSDIGEILKVGTTGSVSVLAGGNGYNSIDGVGTAAAFARPYGLSIDASGNIYVTDIGIYYIRKITPAGVVTTIAGNGKTGETDGKGQAASFDMPMAVAVSSTGNIYVVDAANLSIRKIDQNGVVSLFAGGSSKKTFTQPRGIAVDAAENIYVSDAVNLIIYKITKDALVSNYAGNGQYGSTDGLASNATFKRPTALTIDGSGNLYVQDENKIRKISPK